MIVKLKDIASFSKGTQINGDDLLSDGPYAFLNGGIRPSGKWNAYNVDGNTVTISEGGNSSGYVNFMEAPFWCGAHCYYLFDLKTNGKYLFYALKSQQNRVMQLRSGTCMPNIKKSDLAEFELHIDNDVVKQQAVVTVLDKVESLIDKRQQQLAKLDELVKAQFVEMFGDPVQNERNWKLCSLDSVCSSIVDCPHSTPSYTTENTGYMCIRTSIVKKNQILWDRIEYIPENEYYQRIQRKRPEKGDIVYTREGAILGIAAMIDQDCNVALGQRSMLLSPNPAYCSSQFLCVAMNSDSFLNKALEGLGGSASPHINVGDIKSFPIIMPPIELQDQFVRFVEKSNEQRLTIQQSLDKLEVLKKALMQEYFG